MQTITDQIKTGNLSRFHLLFGEESYMVRYYKNQIIKTMGLAEDEMNLSRFEGDELEISALLDIAQTLPFFAERRLILVSDSGLFKKANDLADFLDGVPETTYFLFVEKAVDKRNRLYKYISKNGCVTESNPKSEGELVNWVAVYLKSAGKAVSRNTVMNILHRTGTSMELLSGELEKLISYAWDRDAVTDSDAEAVCTVQITNKIFDMIDAVAEANPKKAFRLYHDLLESKDPPARILYLFIRHMNQLLQVKEEQGRSSRDETARKIGVPPFAIRKLAAQANRFPDQKLLGMLKELIDLEEAVKSGRMVDQISVEIFISESNL